MKDKNGADHCGRSPEATKTPSLQTKLDSTGVLTWSTLLGGSSYDSGYSIVVDDNGNVYVGEGSKKTWGSPLRAFAGFNDAFVVKINNATFADASNTHWAWDYIERLYNAGITGGCGSGVYCPEQSVTRAQMAIFLLRAKYGSAYNPPSVDGATGFNDVPVDYWAAAWIKQLAAEGITGSCGNGNYCPEEPVTRAQMAIFLVRAFGLP